MTTKPVRVVGHRGAAGDAPENTLASFALAVKQGADAIELDVHPSKDGRLVVCHDTTVNRTTNGKGEIGQMTVEQLKKLDAGSWGGKAFAGERLPLLEDVFDLVPPRMEVNVEIKSDSPALRDALIGMLRERELFGRVFVSSFNHECLVRLKRAEPLVKIGLLYDTKPLRPAEAHGKYGVEPYSLHPHHKLVDRSFVEEAERLGLRVYPWTVNDEPRMRALVELGVSGIITDFPGKLRGLLDRL
ncbi:glycerophosphodiester phosphodiesterase [Paenibacillus flagellatus]|uniref:Glycerophosphodiester phosphodiesterase n=1 Tax=Paenibacillus flagellatus TaxID=2211139 RepID=A0A2V5KBM8_9BACL|nr:glycerophosphodiester phosphodiesterase [Paenibacillus flagellatus]PYI56961.1 glycerophosphodiester phosphodiesterase [Paenibacillus flagellatus]